MKKSSFHGMKKKESEHLPKNKTTFATKRNYSKNRDNFVYDILDIMGLCALSIHLRCLLNAFSSFDPSVAIL